MECFDKVGQRPHWLPFMASLSLPAKRHAISICIWCDPHMNKGESIEEVGKAEREGEQA